MTTDLWIVFLIGVCGGELAMVAAMWIGRRIERQKWRDARALNKTANPCCGICGPSKMYGPGAENGPVCHCGKPSEYEAGLCGPCGLALGWRPPEGYFVEAAGETAR